MTIVWTETDRKFLKSLRIDAGPEPFYRPGGKCADENPRQIPIGNRDLNDFQKDLEAAYVRAMIDPASDRNGGGHPCMSIAYYRSAPINARTNAVALASFAHERGEKCKCGATMPHFACFA